jgi:hypothetical protein
LEGELEFACGLLTLEAATAGEVDGETAEMLIVFLLLDVFERESSWTLQCKVSAAPELT